MTRLNPNTRLLVTDGGRAIVFRNIGQAGRPALEEIKVYHHDNPPTRDQGTDKPPRSNNPQGDRSSTEQADLHQQKEDRFIEGIAADMEADLKTGEFRELIVVAPPVALGVYRKAASPLLRNATLLELNKDLTKHAAAEVAAIVVKALEEG